MKPQRPLRKTSVIFEGEVRETKNNEDVLPPQPTPVRGKLSEYVEGWKRIMNDPYVNVLSIVTKGYRVHPFYARPRGRYSADLSRQGPSRIS